MGDAALDPPLLQNLTEAADLLQAVRTTPLSVTDMLFLGLLLSCFTLVGCFVFYPILFRGYEV